MKSFDLIVIGTGAAGASAAFECRSAGWNVAIVDSRPFGGTCALRGCDPKKVLVGAAEIIERSRQMAGKGIRAEDIRIDWPVLMQFKRPSPSLFRQNASSSFCRRELPSFTAAP